MPALAARTGVELLRERLASLDRGAGGGKGFARPARGGSPPTFTGPAARPPRPPEPVERPVPKGFEPWPTPFGIAWRWAEIRPVGRVEGRPPPVAHAYLDTETTGLSGGTGTYAFAAALARPVAGGLEVVQLFLPEPAGEPAFLHALQDELRQSAALGTYNGATFDLPLLRTRWVMARMPGDLEHPEHVDLLKLARALLRQRLENCTLRNVELALLGFERDDEVAGAVVPDAYFTYLRRGRSPLLEAALEHNRQDVVSLLYLHARLLMRLDGDDPWMEAADWLALGRHLLREGRRADGWRALRNALDMRQGPASATAALLLARTLVRRRSHRAAEAVLAQAQAALPEEAMLAIARARVLEWRLGRLAAALDVVRDAERRGPHPGPLALDLQRRGERLQRRLGGSRLEAPALDGGQDSRARQLLLVSERTEGGHQGRFVGARLACDLDRRL